MPTALSCQSDDREEEDGNEVSTSSNFAGNSSTASNIPIENGGPNVDHGVDSGMRKFLPISSTVFIISQFFVVFFSRSIVLPFAIRLLRMSILQIVHMQSNKWGD